MITHELLRNLAGEALNAARKEYTSGQEYFRAVNWGDLQVVNVLKCVDGDGSESWQVLIEEANSVDLERYVWGEIKRRFHGILPDIEIRTEW